MYHLTVQSVYYHQHQAIQAHHIRYVPKVHSTRRLPSHPLWYSCRYLWASRQQSITCSQSVLRRLLLAHSPQRHRGHSQKVHWLSKVRHKATRTRIGMEDNTISVALRPVGTWHGRTTQKIFQGKPYSYSCESWLTHQVDRNSTHHKFNYHYNSQLHQIYHISLWRFQ